MMKLLKRFVIKFKFKKGGGATTVANAGVKFR